MKLKPLLEVQNIHVNKNGKLVGSYKSPYCNSIFLSSCGLTSLRGSPDVISNSFYCYDNKLTSLRGGPSKTYNFVCNHNKLTSLKYAPSVVDGNFDCSNNLLISLEHCPAVITGYFECSNNLLISLEHCPAVITGYFDCDSNKLKSLEGCPARIGSYFTCELNQLTSLEGIHKHLKEMDGTFYAMDNPIKSHVLGLFLVKGCNTVGIDNLEVNNIMNKWLPKGRAGLIPCQNELIAAGLEEYAQI